MKFSQYLNEDKPERKLELIEFMIHQHWGTKTLIKAIQRPMHQAEHDHTIR